MSKGAALLSDVPAIQRQLRRKSLLRFVSDSYTAVKPKKDAAALLARAPVKLKARHYDAGWVHRDICERLERFSEAVARGESPRLMLFMPPRHGKSFIASERFPVWHLGQYPDHNIITASYGQELSNKFSRRARELAQSEYGTDTFPDLELTGSRKAVQEWETTYGGGYKAVGVGGGITGSGAHILILDDLVKDWEAAQSKTVRDNHWEWYTSTAYTRLMPGGGVLVIMTRWHEDDIAGRLLEAAKNGEGDQWEIVCYPAIAEEDEEHRKAGEALHPGRFPLPALEKIKAVVTHRMGLRAWLALYQQRPTPEEGGIIKRAWMTHFYRELPAQFDQIIQSWDCAFKDTKSSDFVVGQVWGRKGSQKYLLDQVRGRMDFTATVAAVRLLSKKWPRAIAKLVEDKANGPAVISALRGQVEGIIAVNPEGGKVARANAVAPQWEAGNVLLPDPAYHDVPWLHDFVEEVAVFDNGKNDDQVDSMTQALIRLGGRATIMSLADIAEAHGVQME